MAWRTVCFCSHVYEHADYDAPCPHCGEGAPMTDRVIMDYLRAATRARIIEGWRHVGLGLGYREWVVNASAGCRQMSREDVLAYVEMLRAVGVEPEPIRWPE